MSHNPSASYTAQSPKPMLPPHSTAQIVPTSILLSAAGEVSVVAVVVLLWLGVDVLGQK